MGASLEVTLFWLLINGDGFPKDFKKSLSPTLPKFLGFLLSDLFFRLPDPPKATGISVYVHISNNRLLRVLYMKPGCSASSVWHVVVASFVTVLDEHTPLVIS